MSDPNGENESKRKVQDGEVTLPTPVTDSFPTEGLAATDMTGVPLSALRTRYDILAELGRGGMGVVYMARDRETDAIVALKVLRPDIAARPELLERFKTELLLARKITHKNVCRVYDLNRFGDAAAISMEYVEGESLRSILARVGGASLRWGLGLARQMCAALAEAHAQGVAHRDLKPENILIDRRGNVKVMDFGIARSLDDAATQQTAGILGTPAYMSPEQAEGKRADARSDIYSLGLILYEMFTGKQALQAETPVALAHKQIHETPIPPREAEPLLPNFLDRAIERCLEKKPEKRFQSITDLEAALNEKAEAKPSLAEVGSVVLPVHLTRWQRSDWLLVAGAIAGVALFFPFFNRTSPAPRSKISFDRSVLLRIAQEYAQKLGASPVPVSRTDAWGNEFYYDYLAQTAGAPVALEFIGKPLCCSIWQVSWTEGKKESALQVDNNGALERFERDYSSTPSDEKLSVEEARPLAEHAVRDYFGADPSLLRPETAALDVASGPATTRFTWLDPNGYHGLTRSYEVRLVGRSVRFLDSHYQSPPFEWDYDWFAPQMLPFFALFIPMMIIGFFQRRRVNWSAQWRIVLVSGVVVFVEWSQWHDSRDQPTAVLIISLLSMGVFMGFFGFFVSVCLERAVRKVAPAKFLTLSQELAGKNVPESFGLAALRGGLIGLALLGLDSLLIWAGTAHTRLWLDSFVQITHPYQLLRRALPTLGVFLGAFWEGTMVIAIAYLASLAAGFIRRIWLRVPVAAALAAVLLPGPLIGLAAIQPYPWKIVLLFVECLGLALCYFRFDVLTIFCALFTFQFCWRNYSLLVMLQPAGNTEEWVAFALFGLFALAAAAIAFQSSLRAGYRRVKLAFG